MISGPAYDANGNLIPTPQTLGGLSSHEPAHRFQPATPAVSPAPLVTRAAVPPPRGRGGSVKGPPMAHRVVVSNGVMSAPRKQLLLRRQQLARVLLADAAEGAASGQEASDGSLVIPEGAGAAGGKVGADALPAVEEQPMSAEPQSLPADQPVELAADGVPHADSSLAQKAGPAATGGALSAATTEPVGVQAVTVAQSGAATDGGAAVADGAAVDAAGGDAVNAVPDSEASADLAAAAVVDPAAGAAFVGKGAAAHAGTIPPQAQARCSEVETLMHAFSGRTCTR